MVAGIIGWVALGLIMGFFASKMVNLKGDDPRIGVLMGGVGALVGGALYTVTSGNGVTAFNFTSLLIAAAGAVIVLVGWHMMRGMRSRA